MDGRKDLLASVETMASRCAGAALVVQGPWRQSHSSSLGCLWAQTLLRKKGNQQRKWPVLPFGCYKSYFHRQAREGGGRVTSETQRRRWDDRVDGHEEDLGDNLSECGRVLGGDRGGAQGDPFILYKQP